MYLDKDNNTDIHDNLRGKKTKKERKKERQIDT